MSEVHEESVHALVLRDTMVDLQKRLAETAGTDKFGEGQRLGIAIAIQVLKYHGETYGVGASLGWVEPGVAERKRPLN